MARIKSKAEQTARREKKRSRSIRRPRSAIRDPRSEIQDAVLDFFDRSHRDLPWRRDKDPYRIWVSEVMLQQTRAETVRPFYERWLERFPDLNALCAAPVDDVLKVWEGLGYYLRARNLHSAARVVRERHAGTVPSEIGDLRALPGIGEYTAGAIASIAYGKSTAAVDGNVKRVLCRLLDRPVLSAAQLRTEAARLVPAQRPGDFNQGLMELGATICTPRSPKCAVCPVQAHCLAYAAGTQRLRPARSKIQALPVRRFTTVVLTDPLGRVLLRQRPERELLGGLWEFPDRSDLPEFDSIELTPDRVIAHTFSHFRAEYHVHRARLTRKAKAPRNAALRWVYTSELSAYTLPAAQRRIARLLAQ
jgi:A/G-specific adenine glycosylase